MKWSLIATLALQGIAIAAGVEDAFWSAFIEDVDSFPSAAPSPGPTPAPSPGPTPAPSPGPTEGPTPSPSASPTPAPSPEPSPEPSAAPSEAPTGECSIGSCLNCTAVVGGVEIDCSAILPETQPVCECPECVRELQFKYTGKACQANQVASGTCTDNSPNPFIAGYRITNALDATEVIATGQAQQGDTITVDAISLNGCLPNTLAVTISVPTGAVTQTFTIDSSCDGGQGLILVDDYGAFEARGYSCSPTDIHNCEQVASYGLKVCNTGPEVQQIFEFFLQSKETVTGDMETCDILEDVPPADVTLAPDACYYSTKPANLDRCVNSSYCVDVSASATNPVTGLPPNCPGVDEIKFGWPGLPPVPATPSPSPAPSPAPSPSPTSTCVIDIELTGCPDYNISLVQNCEGRPQVITFRYNGGSCAQSNNLQQRQKFSCEDFNGGPPPPSAKGTQSYITAVPRGGSDLYFSGNVAVGQKFTLNADKEFDKLSADMTIDIYTAEGGTLLQTTNLHLSCSQPLFLFDRFGASQVTSWIETDGRVVSDTQADVSTGTIVVQLDTTPETKPVRLTEMQVITSALDNPIDYTSQIAGTVLEPGASIELPGFAIDIELGVRTRYTFFTTIIGETLDGTNTCNGNSFLECVVGFNLDPVFPTNVPTQRPTLTPFPTGDPLTTPCQIASSIGCTVIEPSINGIIGCDDLRSGASATCPEDQRLLNAYLRYDGSLGDGPVFIVPTCGKSEYKTGFVNPGEVFEFNTRASDTCDEVQFDVYINGDDSTGDEVSSGSAEVPCPGPWTIGNTIVPGLQLAYYVSTSDGGITFDLNALEAEVQIDYIASNTGRSPLVVNSGGFSAPLPFETGALTAVPSTIAQQSRQVLKSDTQTISLSGGTGPVELEFSVFGSPSANAGLTCTSTSTYQFIQLGR